MKHHLTALAHDIDAFCAKLNYGLTAVAIVLGFLVVATALVRAPDLVPGLYASASDAGATPSEENAWGTR